jgi:hypothetical protein
LEEGVDPRRDEVPGPQPPAEQIAVAVALVPVGVVAPVDGSEQAEIDAIELLLKADVAATSAPGSSGSSRSS